MTTGVLAGYPLQNMKVRVFDGSYHDVDSDAMSFELCAKGGFREAGRKPAHSAGAYHESGSADT